MPTVAGGVALTKILGPLPGSKTVLMVDCSVVQPRVGDWYSTMSSPEGLSVQKVVSYRGVGSPLKVAIF